jgi:hypothetical protein
MREHLAMEHLILEYAATLTGLAPAGKEVTKVLFRIVAGVETWEANIPAAPGGAGRFRMRATIR